MIINSYINEQVAFFEGSEMDPTSLMQIARDSLIQLLDKHPEPRCDLEQIIAMLIVANGDY